MAFKEKKYILIIDTDRCAKVRRIHPILSQKLLDKDDGTCSCIVGSWWKNQSAVSHKSKNVLKGKIDGRTLGNKFWMNHYLDIKKQIIISFMSDLTIQCHLPLTSLLLCFWHITIPQSIISSNEFWQDIWIRCCFVYFQLDVGTNWQ